MPLVAPSRSGLYGIPRSTNDWDLNIFLPESRAGEVFEALIPLGIEVTPESYTEVVDSGQVRLSWGDKKVDLFFAYAEFHQEVQARTREAPFEGVQIWVLTGEDIVIFKVIFDRSHDWRDLERLFHRTPYGIDLDYVNHWLKRMLGEDDSRIPQPGPGGRRRPGTRRPRRYLDFEAHQQRAFIDALR